MKNILFLFLVFIMSCTVPVVFDQAYPSDKEDLAFIPKSFQGSFICESDSALVVIADYHVTLHKNHYFNAKMKHIEQSENCRIVDDKMFIEGRAECIPISIVNDSIVRGVYEEIDTLFVIRKGSLARLYKGHLVINQEVKPGEWAVSLLTPEEDGDVTYKAITNKTKIKNVSRVTQTTDITTEKDKISRYKVKPTMREFDRLLADEKVFIECERLLRVKVEVAL